ncbi:hypothetical protein GH723_17630 [Actinomarinicola tropica]|uniref:Uncharacterized protein n=1 Tax=Actinomarinicola tropica TaxID=2789776 RepID=A0A5Q2RJ15_9ACTN|nr:hypothetical protein GH723_17630 [Actinomarinicola tropica]
MLRLAMGALVAVVLLPLALSVVALVGLFDAAMDPDVPGAVATTEQPASVGAWPPPGVVVERLSAEIGRPVTHVASLVVDHRSVVAEVVWPDESPAVEVWRLDHLDGSTSGPEPAAPLDEDRGVVELSALAATPWGAMGEQAVATLAVGGGEVSRIEIRAGDGGQPVVAVHVVHVAGEAGQVVFDPTGVVVSVLPA